MSEQAVGGSILMRYRNATAAIEWLCKVFGFRISTITEGVCATGAAELRFVECQPKFMT